MTSTSQHLRNCVTASGGIDCRNPALLIGAADELDRLHAVLTIARNYIEGETIAGAVVVPEGETPTGQHPSLLAFIDAALTGVELKATNGESQ